MTRILTPSQTCGPLFGFAIFPRGIHQTVDPTDPQAVVIEGSVLDAEDRHIGYQGFLELWSEGQACRVRTFEGKYRAVVKKPAPLVLANGQACAPHLNVAVFARGVTRHLLTRLYFPDEAGKNATDPILQSVAPERRQTLLAKPSTAGNTLVFDICLQGSNETVFFRHDSD